MRKTSASAPSRSPSSRVANKIFPLGVERLSEAQCSSPSAPFGNHYQINIMNKEPEITIATDQEQEMAKNAPPVDLDRITRLYLRWRELADLCDSEIMRTKATPPTLIMSDDEKVRYEQASKTYRFCAESLSLSAPFGDHHKLKSIP